MGGSIGGVRFIDLQAFPTMGSPTKMFSGASWWKQLEHKQCLHTHHAFPTQPASVAGIFLPVLCTPLAFTFDSADIRAAAIMPEPIQAQCLSGDCRISSQERREHAPHN